MHGYKTEILIQQSVLPILYILQRSDKPNDSQLNFKALIITLWWLKIFVLGLILVRGVVLCIF